MRAFCFSKRESMETPFESARHPARRSAGTAQGRLSPIAAVAREVGIPLATLREYARQGLFETVHLGRRVYVAREVIDRIVSNGIDTTRNSRNDRRAEARARSQRRAARV
jgi:hypothetical protein